MKAKAYTECVTPIDEDRGTDTKDESIASDNGKKTRFARSNTTSTMNEQEQTVVEAIVAHRLHGSADKVIQVHSKEGEFAIVSIENFNTDVPSVLGGFILWLKGLFSK
jgi:hypothetical protein